MKCPKCGIGEMSPDGMFSSNYVCDFCGYKEYVPSGRSSLPTKYEIERNIRQGVDEACREMERSAEEVKRSADAYTRTLKNNRAARKAGKKKEEKGCGCSTVIIVLILLFLYFGYFS